MERSQSRHAKPRVHLASVVIQAKANAGGKKHPCPRDRRSWQCSAPNYSLEHQGLSAKLVASLPRDRASVVRKPSTTTEYTRQHLHGAKTPSRQYASTSYIRSKTRTYLNGPCIRFSCRTKSIPLQLGLGKYRRCNSHCTNHRSEGYFQLTFTAIVPSLECDHSEGHSCLLVHMHLQNRD